MLPIQMPRKELGIYTQNRKNDQLERAEKNDKMESNQQSSLEEN
jgi:hypothetical protein